MLITLIISLILLSRGKADFTLKIYRELLECLQKKGYRFLSFEQYCKLRACSSSCDSAVFPEKYIVLRHDVDLKAKNSWRTAQIEHELGIQASYYFRVVADSNRPDIIRQIAVLGHEIGYHYEDMALAHGDVEKAIAHFQEQLAYFRQYYPVSTICMHGAPTSKWDGRELWKHYDYHDYGIIGEPYFDVDFSQVFYLTDTGRCWDGYNVSVRDKIPMYQDQWIEQGLVYHSTADMIKAVQDGRFPSRIMITTHPQRWTNNVLLWIKELLLQTVKNVIKRKFLIK